jgi:glucosamine--fructose-6-phosphate aminotransferase (isomerizing)
MTHDRQGGVRLPDSVLRAEIAEQPDVLRRLLRDGASEVERVADSLRARPPSHVVIAARGSSDNAARYAQYVFGAHNGLVVSLATPSLFTRYHAAPQMAGALVVGVSQSGESPDLVAVVEEGRRQGCQTLAITNVIDSPLAPAGRSCDRPAGGTGAEHRGDQDLYRAAHRAGDAVSRTGAGRREAA